MTTPAADFDTSLKGLSKEDWLTAVEQITDEDGTCERLGTQHFATFVEKGSTLLVTFEKLQNILDGSKKAHPLGWTMVRDKDWSSLCVGCDGTTWFRDKAVFGYFDRLVDDGFFDEFETVVFYGAGSCGYAAAAFSVAAPGARVLVLQPQATLDPDASEWDTRFVHMRRTDFSDRYGFAPDMVDAADQAYVVYDPAQTFDAMHAALFTRPNVQKLRMRHMGDTLQSELIDMRIWSNMLRAAAKGRLDRDTFGKLYRARRTHKPYLLNLLSLVERTGRNTLARALCDNVNGRLKIRRFRQAAKKYEQPTTEETR